MGFHLSSHFLLILSMITFTSSFILSNFKNAKKSDYRALSTFIPLTTDHRHFYSRARNCFSFARMSGTSDTAERPRSKFEVGDKVRILVKTITLAKTAVQAGFRKYPSGRWFLIYTICPRQLKHSSRTWTHIQTHETTNDKFTYVDSFSEPLKQAHSAHPQSPHHATQAYRSETPRTRTEHEHPRTCTRRRARAHARAHTHTTTQGLTRTTWSEA